jgi:hypothetical protein
MQVGKLYEQKLVEILEQMGEIVQPDDETRIAELGLVLQEDQFRVEMEREYVPITGYMDAVHAEGYPIEIKTHYAHSVDKKLESGGPPSEHYCHQLAVYMDFMGVDRGTIISANRANGNIFSSNIVGFGDGVYECKGYRFNLHDEYKRWRKIMEENIIPRKEPDLEYLYRPDVTKKLLDQYAEDKIKKAIKGERVLCDHNWRYQYSSFKDRVIQKEADMKGVSISELCTYTEKEVQFMLDYGNWEWKDTKRGRRLYKKKP